MRAVARVVAEAGGRVTTRYGEPPLLPRATGPGEVYLVGGAAGPLGGDDLRIEIDVCPGASLVVRTVAASMALPGRGGAVSRTEVCARVAAGARLAWLPEPVIAAAGCDHDAVATVELAAGARLVWREELVCGRYGEEPGDLRMRLAVRLDGRPLHRHDLAVGPSAPGWAGAAVLGGARTVGTVLVTPAVDVPGVPEIMALAGPATLGLATGAELSEVRAKLAVLHDDRRS